MRGGGRSSQSPSLEVSGEQGVLSIDRRGTGKVRGRRKEPKTYETVIDTDNNSDNDNDKDDEETDPTLSASGTSRFDRFLRLIKTAHQTHGSISASRPRDNMDTAVRLTLVRHRC